MAALLPEYIETEDELDEVLTRPGPALVDFVSCLQNPLVVLGAGGKMGPTLSVLARRAADTAGITLEVVAVSRFADRRVRPWLEARGVQTISCDLMEPGSLERLPDTRNVIYMVGRKFGTTESPADTWATNALLPAWVGQRYADARLVVLSSGNVYPLVPVASGGADETHPLTPTGEYANSCVARERIFAYLSRKNETPVVLVRLSYAVELRYGVIVDIARRVWAGLPVDVTMGYANCIWQGDANDMTIRSLALATSPALAVNITGSPALSVRSTAQRLGELMDRPARITGREQDTAYLSNTAKARRMLGPAQTPIDDVIRWTAHWVAAGGRLLDKPTHFEVRDGEY